MKPAGSHPGPAQGRNPDVGAISHDHPVDPALSRNQEGELSLNLRGELGQLTGDLGRDDLRIGDSSTIEPLKAFHLAGLEA